MAVLLRQEPLRAAAHHAVEQFPRHPLPQLGVVGRRLRSRTSSSRSTARRRPPGSSACRTSSSWRRTSSRPCRAARSAGCVPGPNSRRPSASGSTSDRVSLQSSRVMPYSLHASMIHCRTMRSPATYCFSVLVLIRLLVALDEPEGGVAAVDAGSGEHARARRIDARPRHHAAVHHVGIGKHVRRRRLRIARRRHAVGEVGEVLPHLRLMERRAAATCVNAHRPGRA